MPDIALIGGTIFLESKIFARVKCEEVSNEFGKTAFYIKDDTVFLPRHGMNKNIPPHKINHQANMKALKDIGVKWVVGANSVGTLNVSISPGSLIIPDDYINLWGEDTFFHRSLVHITPHIDEDMRKLIIQSARALGISLIESGVYVQTRGPRLETRAEVRFLKTFADVVGMTMGSEATASREINLKYACIASVDNYAHGLTDSVLMEKDIRENARKSADRIKRMFFKLVEVIRETEKGGE